MQAYVTPRLEKAIKEAATVKTLMADESWHGFPEYQLLLRVLAEQSQVSADGTASPKDKKEITSKSLQNPSDPDAAGNFSCSKSEHIISTSW